MSYDTWDWTILTGVGATCNITTDRLSPVLSNTVEAGYLETGPKYSRDNWLFKVNFKVLRPSGYVYLVNFYHDHRGGQLFYFKLPFGLQGIPLELYSADPGGQSPWSSEVDLGAGEAPTYLARIMNNNLPIVRRDDTVQNYWYSESPLEIRTV
jgi:hypothetical protein